MHIWKFSIKIKSFKTHLEHHQQRRDGAGGLATTTACEGLWSTNLSGISVREISDKHCD